MINVVNLLQNNKEKIGLSFNEIKWISKLWWLSNNNYLLELDNTKYLLRLEKSKHSDSLYGGKFDLEYKIIEYLYNLSIVPKIYFNWVLDGNKVMIEEFIIWWKEKFHDILVANAIKKLQSIWNIKVNFLSEVNTIQFYFDKYKNRISDNSMLIKEYKIILAFIKKYGLSIEKNLSICISHADLRSDNVIVTEEKCFIIDWESVVIWEEAIDIAWYYIWNIFFERYGKDYNFNIDDLDKWIFYFDNSKSFKVKIYFFTILQYFSDLCWLENYIKIHKIEELVSLFDKNYKRFNYIFDILDSKISRLIN